MIPELIARQAETEDRGYYAPDTHAQFARNGFYRILVPRRYGGYEFGIDVFLRVCMALTRGCPSTGWMYCLGATHALAAATLFCEQAQDELFADVDFICPGALLPAGSATQAANGRWQLSGTWQYCSGSPYANYFMGHTLVASGDGGAPSVLLFAAPRSQWRRLDDWGSQLGLRGSGSHSIVIDSAEVPCYLALPGVHRSQVDVSAGTPGRDLHGNAEYGGGQLSIMNLEPAALAVGMAKGALDAYEDLLRHRSTLLPPFTRRADDPDYQFWYGDAYAMIGTAEAALLHAIKEWQDTSACGASAFTREADLRISVICRHVLRLCWEAVESYLLPTAGSSSVRHGERLERVWRDMSMMRSHAGLSVLLPTVAVRELARSLTRASR